MGMIKIVWVVVSITCGAGFPAELQCGKWQIESVQAVDTCVASSLDNVKQELGLHLTTCVTPAWPL